ncbi:MAG: hypothetical protein HY539_05775, partial [Deltaproteobacteria bacterium]|nr:hypothetical protein [Deltaproteobacteria bacterium]
FEMSEERHQFVPVFRCGENPLEVHEGDDEESPRASIPTCNLLPWEKSPHIQVDMAVQKALSASISVRYLSPESDSEEDSGGGSGSGGSDSGSDGTGGSFSFTRVLMNFNLLSLLSGQTSSFDLDPSGVIAIDEVKRYVPIKKNRMEITCRASGITNTETVVHRVEIGPLPSVVEEDGNIELGESGFQLGGDFAFHTIPQTSQGDDCDWRMIRWDFGNNPQDMDHDDDGGQCNATLLWQFAQDMKITQVSSEERVVGRYKTPWTGELKVKSYQTENEAAINNGVTCNDNVWSFKASDYTEGGILKEGNAGLSIVASNWSDPEPYNNAPIPGGGRTGSSQGFIIKQQKNVSRSYSTCNRYKIKAKSFDGSETEQHTLNLQYHSEFEVGDREDIGSISNWCVNYSDGWGRGVTWRIPFEAQHIKEIDTKVYFWGCRHRPTLSEFATYQQGHYWSNVCGWFKETRGEEIFYGSDFLGRDDWDLDNVLEALAEEDPDVNYLSRTDWYEDLPLLFPGSMGEGYYISTRNPQLDGVKYYNFDNEYKLQGNIHPIAQPEEVVPDENCDPGSYNTVSREEREMGGGGSHIKISNARFRQYRVVMKAKGYDGRTLTRKRQFRISNRRFIKAPLDGEARGSLCDVDADCYHYCEDPANSRGPCEVCRDSNLNSLEGMGHRRCAPWKP